MTNQKKNLSQIILLTAVSFFPLSVRKKLAITLGNKSWLPRHSTLSFAILSDWAKRDADGFHRFLWTNHLGYAKWYEEFNDFGPEKLRPIRKMLFYDLKVFLLSHNIDPSIDITSVFDVGCSSGSVIETFRGDFRGDFIFEFLSMSQGIGLIVSTVLAGYWRYQDRKTERGG